MWELLAVLAKGLLSIVTRNPVASTIVLALMFAGVVWIFIGVTLNFLMFDQNAPWITRSVAPVANDWRTWIWLGVSLASLLVSGMVIYWGSKTDKPKNGGQIPKPPPPRPENGLWSDMTIKYPKKLIGRWQITIDTLRLDKEKGEWVDWTLDYPMQIFLDDENKTQLVFDLYQKKSLFFK
jgi:hypothetical protein